MPLPEEHRSEGQPDSVRLNIGLDFGTSSTKVCIRPTLGEGRDVKTYPIAFDAAAIDPLFGPSTIGLKDGRFYFGSAADAMDPSCRIWRHIKVCVACEAENTIGDGNCYCSGVLTEPDVVQGRFLASGVAAQPSDLAALYLAWVLGEVIQAIPETLRRGSTPVFTCNVGVPVDQIDKKSPLHRAYSRIAGFAWRMRGHVRQGIDAATALGWIEAFKQTGQSHSSAVGLCPETGAAIVSYINNPTTREGMYGLVDIGAWTTDISFFRLSDVAMLSEGIRTTAFYDGETHRVAAGRIDQRASDLLEVGRSDLTPIVTIPATTDERQNMFQTMRETGEAHQLSTPAAKRAAASCLEYARSAVAAAVCTRFSSTRAKASKKEGLYNQDDWKRVAVFLLGGGAEENSFEEFLKWCQQGCSIKRLPDDARFQGDGDGGAGRSRRLQVAAGLAFPVALWPKQFLPSQVEPIRISESLPVKSRPDRDDLYPK